MINDLAQQIVASYGRYLRLHVVAGIVLIVGVILIPKTGMLSDLKGPSLTILVEILIGLFVGSIYYMSDLQDSIRIYTWLYAGKEISAHPEHVEQMRRGPALHEVFNAVTLFILFIIVFLTGSIAYSLVWHEIGLFSALSEYAFHLIRATIVISVTFFIGVLYARVVCLRSARLLVTQSYS